MNHATEIIDVIKVNVAGWGTIGITNSGLINMAETIQALGTAALILLTIGYTLYKWKVAVDNHEWDKEDRNDS